MSEQPRQPRQPKDLPGLIKFCMEATANEDAPSAASTFEAMDPERRRWLEEAIESMTVDVVKQLAECIKMLNDPAVKDPEASEDQLATVQSALDCVNDFVDNIDMANNFHKLGGFEILKNCLVSPHQFIREESAGVTAELAQNNPYCQTHLVADGFIPCLVTILDTDLDENCRFKALSAISCLIRDNPTGQEEFLKRNGCEVVLRNIQTSKIRLRVKACFFISSVCQENAEFKNAFSSMGMAHQLVYLLQREEHEQSHEHLAKALLTLLADNRQVIDEVRTIKELDDFIRVRLELLKGQEEFEEEGVYFQEIQEICFGSDPKKNGEDPDR